MSKALRAKLSKDVDAVDVAKLKALPSKEQLKGWYAAVRPILKVVAGLPLLPSKYATLIDGFISVADTALGVG